MKAIDPRLLRAGGFLLIFRYSSDIPAGVFREYSGDIHDKVVSRIFRTFSFSNPTIRLFGSHALRGYSGDIIQIILNIIPHCIQKADEPLIEVPRAAIKYEK